MKKTNETGNPVLGKYLNKVFGPLVWITVIIGAPLIAIVCENLATAIFPEKAFFASFFVFAWFVIVHLTYTIILRKQLSDAVTKLVRKRENSSGGMESRTASTIASAVAIGLTLIVSIFLLDYYGHREAAEFAARTKAFDKQSEKYEKEKNEKENPFPILFLLESFDKNALNVKSDLEKKYDAKFQRLPISSDAVKNPSSATNFSSIIATPIFLKQENEKVIAKKLELIEPKPTALEVAGTFLGTFGDFFGGVLNPLLTFGTLVALAITILLQRTQLDIAEDSAQRNSEVMEKQAFETTFFNMLNLHNTTVQDLKFDTETIEIPIWYAEHNDDEEIEDVDYDIGNPDELAMPISLDNAEGRQVFARVLQLMDSKLHDSTPTAVYHRIQKYHNYFLGHYFRTLYQLLELVDEYSEEVGYEKATRYSSIVRAQLSANELVLLFYNCSYELVDSGQFRKLLKRYEILEHMPLQHGQIKNTLDTPGYMFCIEDHIAQYFMRVEDDNEFHYEAGAFGENPVIEEYLGRI